MAKNKIEVPSALSARLIVILSPQPWSYLNISKQHYAKALAKKNTVFYINPPSFGFWYFQNNKRENISLNLVEFKIPLPELIKFKVPWLYQLAAQYFLIQTVRKYFIKADFCFDFGWHREFDSISFFPAYFKIYFPVDDFKNLSSSMRGSDLAFTVSEQIRKKINSPSCHFINHGLSEEFSVRASRSLNENKPWKKGSKIKVGYSGNLFIPFLDVAVFEFIIKNYPDIDFYLFGSEDFNQRNESHIRWNYVIKNSHNVKCFGQVTPGRLASEFEDIDLFFICYRPDGNYHSENSHKIMEYLSTGKVIVSSCISHYIGTGLLEMPDHLDNQLVKKIFGDVVVSLDWYNSLEKMNERRTFALHNTYEKNIEKIENVILGSRQTEKS